jgi:hypothetical protein
LGTVRAKAAAAARHGAVGLAIAVPPLADRVDRLDLRDGTVREGTLTKVAGGYRLRERDVRRIPVAADEVDRVVLKDGTVVTLRRGAGGAPIELPAAAVDRFYPHDAVRSVETGVTPLPVSDLGEGWLPGGKPPEGPLPVVAVSDPVVREMLPGNDLDALESRVDAGPGSFRIAERVVVIRVKTAVETRPTRNVLAVLPGARKPGRYVVVSAHYDHLGIDRSGEVMNGADDNASGTSALLAVARAFRDLGRAPDRSVLFLALTAEERGLVGSRQFVRDPPVPLDSILAELNMDMVGRGVADELDVFAGPLGTNLGDLLEASASAAGIRGDFEIVGPPDGVVPPPVGRAALDLPVPKTRSNLFGRSDHATFYRKGIPAAFLFGGLNPDYHRPTDTPDKLNPEKMARVARMVFRCALGIADGGLSPAKEDPPR